jgi:hypothetical protein
MEKRLEGKFAAEEVPSSVEAWVVGRELELRQSVSMIREQAEQSLVGVNLVMQDIGLGTHPNLVVGAALRRCVPCPLPKMHSVSKEGIQLPNTPCKPL